MEKENSVKKKKNIYNNIIIVSIKFKKKHFR